MHSHNKKVSELVIGDRILHRTHEGSAWIQIKWIARVYRNSYLLDTEIGHMEFDGDRVVSVQVEG